MTGPGPVPSISPEDAQGRATAEGADRALIVDVREPGEFAQARIPGSVLIPLGQFIERYAELPADRPLLMVCRSGSRSAGATAFLLRNGFPEVANIAGGILAWYQAGLPVSTSAPTPGEGALER
jgi:rhodanese-related sulfurtransferase